MIKKVVKFITDRICFLKLIRDISILITFFVSLIIFNNKKNC